jgi:hypothetical protein
MKTTNKTRLTVSAFDPTDSEQVYNVATAVAYSVLNKCIDPQRHNTTDRPTDSGYNPALVNMRSSIPADRSVLDNGKLSSITRFCTVSDAFDLIQTAATALLFEYQKAVDRSDLPFELDRPYSKKQLRKRVYIKEQADPQFETVQTTPVQEVFRAVRREIMRSRAVATDPRNGYTYIEQYATDPDSGEPVELYRRMLKYADIGGYAINSNGPTACYTATEQAAVDTDRIIDSLELTGRQAQILNYRIQGYGYKAIATRLNITEQAVLNTCKRIQVKAVKAGYNPVE